AIVYEMPLAIMAAMSAVEASAWLQARRKGEVARFAGGYAVAVAAMLVAALAAYLAFRFAYPSRYSGNALPADSLARILPSIARHIVDATAFPHWFAVGTLNLANSGDLLRSAVVAAGIAVAIERSRP